MNNDLISRSALLEELSSFSMRITGSVNAIALTIMDETKKSIEKMIEEQPVVYDLNKMTENEIKAIQWIKSVKDDAMVTLNHIENNEPNINPLLYTGRKENAETIIKGFEELEQYRLIGTVSECRKATEKHKSKKPNKRQVGNTLIGKKYHCPNCNKKLYDCLFKNGELIHVLPGSRKSKFCEDCGQGISWQNDNS